MPKVPYSALILALFSILFACAVNADYFSLSPKNFAAILVSGVIVSALGIYRVVGKGGLTKFSSLWRSANSISEFTTCLTFWIVGLLLILVPLGFGYAPDSLITGHFICNDSALHSILAEGIDYTKERGLNPFYYSASPRGIHSFTYYFNKLVVRKPTSRIILATSIASFSLIIFWADMFVRRFRFSSKLWILLPSLSVISFLLSTTTYLIFLGQISALSMTLASLTALFYFQSFGSPGVALFLFLSLSLGAFTSYGLFSGSIIGFGMGLSVLSILLTDRRPREIFAHLQNIFDPFMTLKGILLTGSLFALSWPSLQFALYVLRVQGSGTVASDLTSAVGNLPDGYLSPLHLSGLWPSGIGYREPLLKGSSAYSNILMVVIAAQLWLIASARFTAPTILMLITVLVPWLSSALFITSPYVNFKYLSYLIPVFTLTAGTAGVLITERVSYRFSGFKRYGLQATAALVLSIYVGFAIWNPILTASITPTVLNGHLATFEAVSSEIMDKKALVLSREDWLQYYAQPDDILPLTLYVPQNFHGQSIDIVVIDNAYKPDALEFLKPYPKLLELVSNSECMKHVGERFESYERSCAKQNFPVSP